MGGNLGLGHKSQMMCALKWAYRLSMLSWLLAFFVFVYWRYLDDPIPVIVNQVEIIPDKPHRAGEWVTLHVDVCQNLPGVPGTGVRMIRGPIGGSGYAHFLAENYIDPSVECTKHDRPIMLPRALEPGQYQYIFQGVYQVNPIKTKVFTQPPVPFEIVP